VVSIGTYFAIEMPARNAIRGLRRTMTRPTEGGRSVSVTKQYGP
jgi:hypothetical protein